MLQIRIGYTTIKRLADNAQVGKSITLFTQNGESAEQVLTSAIQHIHRVSEEEVFFFTLNSVYQVKVI